MILGILFITAILSRRKFTLNWLAGRYPYFALTPALVDLAFSRIKRMVTSINPTFCPAVFSDNSTPSLFDVSLAGNKPGS